MNRIIVELKKDLEAINASLDFRKPTREFERHLSQIDFALYREALYGVSYRGREFLVTPSHWKDGQLYFNLTRLDDNGAPLEDCPKETVQMAAFRELAEKSATRIVYDLQLAQYHQERQRAEDEKAQAIRTEIEKAEKRKEEKNKNS